VKPVSDIRDALRQRQHAYQPAPGAFDRLVRRRDRRQRAKRLSTIAVALLVSAAAVWALFPLSGLGHRSAATPIDRSTVGRLEVAWTAGVGDSPTAPVVRENRVFVGTGSGVLYALDVRGGQVIWVGRLRGSIVSAPAIYGDQVVVHTTSGVLAAFDTECGTRGATCLPVWTAFTGDDVGSPPTVADGVIYVNAGDDRMLAFEDCSSGPCDPAWIGRTPSYGQPRSPIAPAVADGSVWTVLGNDTVVFPTRCDRVCEPTQSQFAGSMSIGPVVGDRLVVLGSSTGYLYGFSANCPGRCRAIWRARADEPTTPAVDEGLVFVSGAPEGGLAAVPERCPTAGAACEPLWVGEISGSPTSSVITAAGVVYVGSSDGNLYAFPTACDEVCSPSSVVRIGSSIEAPAAWEGRALLVTAADGTLRALTVDGFEP
jgi:outer membrane protein assembly factor BamB